MSNCKSNCPCYPQQVCTSCKQISSNAQTYTVVTQKGVRCKPQTEYPRPIYEPCGCPIPPPCPCPTPTPPTPCPCPCPPPINQNAHVGSSKATLLVGGPTGTIPIDMFFSKNGSDVCQVNPVKIKGPHTYLVEWSGAIDPIDPIAAAQIQLLLDGVPVAGSGNYTDITATTDGAVALSGGAIVTVPAGCHALELGYTTGPSGAEVANMNIRIVELA